MSIEELKKLLMSLVNTIEDSNSTSKEKVFGLSELEVELFLVKKCMEVNYEYICYSVFVNQLYPNDFSGLFKNLTQSNQKEELYKCIDSIIRIIKMKMVCLEMLEDNNILSTQDEINKLIKLIKYGKYCPSTKLYS